MTPQEKLKQAAEIAIPNVEEYEEFVEHDRSLWISGATSEAARDYWQGDVFEFHKFVNSNYIHYLDNRYYHNSFIGYFDDMVLLTIEELYKEFTKKKGE